MNAAYPVQLAVDYPDRELDRLTTAFRIFTVIPIAAWFAILVTGRYPRGMFEYVQGVIRWHNRVLGYAWLLVTDEYPPFSLR